MHEDLSITGLDNVHCAEQWAARQRQPAEWLHVDGRADTRAPNLGAPERGWAHGWSYYLCYAAYVNAGTWSNVFKLDR